MCTIWGYAQGWWTVAGLISDIVGFAVLALDVLREYRRHRRTTDLQEAAQAAEFLRDNPEQPETKIGEKESYREYYERLVIRTHRGNMLLMQEVYDDDGSIKNLKTYDEKAAAFRTKSAEAAAKALKRAPIIFGVVLVFLGFVLQVVGAVPCS